jgi:phosphonopyruvate decarboxylase
MMQAERFIKLLEEAGFDFFTGVPCSLLAKLLALLEQHPRLSYIPAVREDAAVGLATGAYLTGRRPVVLMQNSGLGTSLNAFTSLNLLYKIPLLVVMSWRGYEGKDAPEHLIMGEAFLKLLESIGMPYLVLDPGKLDMSIAWAERIIKEKEVPAAFLVKPGLFE